MTPCPLCRTEIDDASPRCPQCGARVKRDIPAPVPTPTLHPTAEGTVLLAPQRSAPPTALPTWAPPVAGPRRRRVGRVIAIGAGVVAGLFALLVVIGLVVGAIDENKANDTIDAYVAGRRGEHFSSVAGAFEADFPSRPVPVDQRMAGPNGTELVFHDFVSHPGRRYAFEVGYFDLATQVALPDPHAALEGVVDSMAGELNGRVTSSGPAQLHGIEAQNFTVEFTENDESVAAIGRVALRGNRLYLVAITAPGLQRDAFERLVGTFEFTGTAAS
jgi:hypothetical protein